MFRIPILSLLQVHIEVPMEDRGREEVISIARVETIVRVA
jgi:hypothetical protein